jgi:hypothetical protein
MGVQSAFEALRHTGFVPGSGIVGGAGQRPAGHDEAAPPGGDDVHVETAPFYEGKESVTPDAAFSVRADLPVELPVRSRASGHEVCRAVSATRTEAL